MTRAEHIAWCKQRALEYVERGELENALASMLSDLCKHPETADRAAATLGPGIALVPGWISSPGEVRKWIESFN